MVECCLKQYAPKPCMVSLAESPLHPPFAGGYSSVVSAPHAVCPRCMIKISQAAEWLCTRRGGGGSGGDDFARPMYVDEVYKLVFLGDHLRGPPDLMGWWFGLWHLE